MNILVINAGSSSLKYQLLNPETGALLAKGLCERIGIDGKFTYKPQVEGKQVLDAVDVAMPTHSEAIQAVLNALVDTDNGVIGSMQEIDAVGHRVVHGGEAFASSVLITDEVMKPPWRSASPWPPSTTPPTSPASTPASRRHAQGRAPWWPCSTPPSTRPCPPRPICTPCPMSTMRRTRFAATASTAPPTSMSPAGLPPCWARSLEELKLISCHLGNGSSVTAVDGGKSVDTSMGFTPLAGLPMGTRSGDLDAGILQYLMNKYGMDIDEMLNILNKKSGVQGALRRLLRLPRPGECRRRRATSGPSLAVDMFDYGVKKLHRRLCRRHGRRGRHYLHRRRGRERR